MNTLGITLVWLAVQVTILALAGIALTTHMARRAPGAGGATALATLIAILLLTILAACPLPSWWTVRADAKAAATPPPANTTGNPDHPAPESMPSAGSSGGSIDLSRLLSALKDLARIYSGSDLRDDGSWQWPATLALVAAMGMSIGVLRLACGLLSIHCRRRRSRPVADAELRDLIEHLRVTLGVKRQVALVEWTELKSAAAVGWRKPVLLLPGDWRDWTPDQRQAVIAHELAHVARSDFARAVLAQLSLILHFWHPLVHFLVRQFQVQQELAADAAAALAVGGRTGYLRALAALALRSDGRAHGWPAPALLSPKGTLLRRVEMLRSGREGNYTASRAGRRLTFGGLIALAITLSLFRGSLDQTLAEAPRNAARKAVAETVPFDLSLLGLDDDKNAVGAYGFRPAAVFHRPSTEPWCREMNRFIDEVGEPLDPRVVDEYGKPLDLGRFGIHVEDVEQVMGRVYVRGKNKPRERELMFSVNVLGMTRDMDWANLRDRGGAKLRQHSWKGQAYVSLALPPAFNQFASGGKGDGYFWAPDARTLIFDTEDNIKRLIEAKISNRKPATPGFAAGWDRFSRGLFVVALDQTSPWLQKISLLTEADIKEEKPGTPEYDLMRSELGFVKNVSEVVIGCAGDDDLEIGLWARTITTKRAAALTRYCERAIAAGKSIVAAERSKDPASKNTDAIALAFVQNLLTAAVVHHEGNVVTVHTSVASGFNALLSQFAKNANPVDQKAEQKK
jgi:beta-lactamase regulating signal transducer with metallopeptidase domain